MTEPERGQDGYDPCSKYDHIYKAVCHNMNFVTKHADLDFGIDESTWGFSGYCGEVGGRLMNKPKDKGTYFHARVFYGVHVTLTNVCTSTFIGGQTNMLFDVGRRYPRAYVHRYKKRPRPEGFGQEGPAEMHYLLSRLD